MILYRKCPCTVITISPVWELGHSDLCESGLQHYVIVTCTWHPLFEQCTRTYLKNIDYEFVIPCYTVRSAMYSCKDLGGFYTKVLPAEYAYINIQN